MKKIIVLLIYTLIPFGINAQNIVGAWENYSSSENGEKLKTVIIFSNDYNVVTTYNETSGKFIHTNGGSWKLDGTVMTENVEFNSSKPELVGTANSFKVVVSENEFELTDSNKTFVKIDDGTPGELDGAWLMSGRVRDGKIESRVTTRPRKTMKILSGTRFQWIAYDTDKKEFMGSGGGTYTSIDGEYTEHIEFFSRDDSKAGLSLKFNFEIKDGNWNHSGLSSKGDPIHEIWSIRN